MMASGQLGIALDQQNHFKNEKNEIYSFPFLGTIHQFTHTYHDHFATILHKQMGLASILINGPI